MNDRMKMIIYGGVTAAVFVVCALVPLLFRGEEGRPKDTELSVGERAEIFGDYWNDAGVDCRVSTINNPDRNALELCSARMEQISSLCLVDKSSGQVRSEGSEYISVSKGENEIRLCRMWLEVQSDWRSWLDVCFDMDNGDVYYFYLSAECVSDPGKYSSLLPDGMDAQSIAGHIAWQRGYKLVDVNMDVDDSGSVIAIYTGEDSIVCMRISCICYKSALIDVKVCCV